MPQLRQPAHGEQSEHRPDGQAHRFGDLTRPLVFVATVAAPQQERDAGAHDDERE